MCCDILITSSEANSPIAELRGQLERTIRAITSAFLETVKEVRWNHPNAKFILGPRRAID